MAGKPERSGRPLSQSSMHIEQTMDLIAAGDDAERRVIESVSALVMNRRRLRAVVTMRGRKPGAA